MHCPRASSLEYMYFLSRTILKGGNAFLDDGKGASDKEALGPTGVSRCLSTECQAYDGDTAN